MGSAGMPVAAVNRSSTARRAGLAMAGPRRMSGRRAASSSSITRRRSPSATGIEPRGSMATRATLPSPTFVSSRSPGRLTCTGPGRPFRATSSANAMSSPSLAASLATHEALVTGALAHAAAGGDGPDHLDRQAADTVQLVHHIAHDAAVVRHDVDDLAHLRALGAGGDINDPVLLGEIADHGLGIFHDVAEALL